MVELKGPCPEEMKPGEVYRAVQSGNMYELRKVESEKKGSVIVLDLPPNIAYVMKVYAAILEDTLEGMILQQLEDVTDNLRDGDVLGEEIGAVQGVI